MEMMQYKPWEKTEVNQIISSVQGGQLPILDVQLGGNCCNSCVYCDTPRYDEPCKVNLTALEKIIEHSNIRGVYICGLGEPTHCQNIRHLREILAICKAKGIWLSMFTNLMYLDDKLLDYIDNGTLNILFKYDTEVLSQAKELYRQKNDNRLEQYFNNFLRINEVSHANNGVTNIGASIVPTSINYDELRKIISCCLRNKWFPLVGQLESAGMCSKRFNELKLTEGELYTIKQWMLVAYGIDYEIPTCPATISGIHITNRNKIILDKRTGLSCPWFWLDEPQIEVIGDINDMDYDEIVQRIQEYRDSRFQDVEEMAKNVEQYPFGGCGGNVKKLLKTYIDIKKEDDNSKR